MQKGKGGFKFVRVNGRNSDVGTGRAREGVGISLSKVWSRKVKEWKKVTTQNFQTKVKVVLEKCRLLGAFWPGMEKTKEKREVF